MRTGLLIAVLLSIPLLSQADDITDAIDQAVTYYNDGQTQQAISQLEFAAQMIRQARAAELAGFLPEPFDGWDAQDNDSNVGAMAMLGGGTTVSRDYTKGGQSVSISIITDSPMLQSMMMLFTNPAILAAQGGQLMMIQGQQAMVKSDGVTMVINNTYLIQVDGSASQADYVAYANAIDIAGIQAF